MLSVLIVHQIGLLSLAASPCQFWGAGAGRGPAGGCPAPGTIHRELENDLN